MLTRFERAVVALRKNRLGKYDLEIAKRLEDYTSIEPEKIDPKLNSEIQFKAWDFLKEK